MKNAKKNILIGLTLAAILAIAGYAVAHDDFGYRGGHMMDDGYHMGRGYGPHMGYGDYGRYADLTEERVERLGNARTEFYEATEALRNDIYQKRLELRAELAKQEPDTGKLKDIQKDVSQLEGELDQKRLAYELELDKIAPEESRGFAGRGFGGPCWN
jgi:Spy/CpxP family protein refolding chaperone